MAIAVGQELAYLAPMTPDRPHRQLTTAAESALLVIDMQERLVPALVDAPVLMRSIGLLADAARLLGVPTAVTEHCPDGIGRTAAELRDRLAHAVFADKQHFAAVHAPAFAPVMQAWRDRMIVLCGAEAHVCVAQTALGLLDAGHRVGVAVDAIGARHHDDLRIALDRLRQAGVVPFSVEMLITEWLADAADPRFKPLLQAIKARHALR
ncbi:MAG: isochorismatase family protein [Alphaproteobacteria bacterium]